MSQDEVVHARDPARVHRALPHFGALVTGGAALWGWHRFAGATEWLDGLFATSVYWVGVMFSPVVGASLILLLQGESRSERRQEILVPYVWWAAAGLLSLLLLVLSGANSGPNSPAPPILQFAFWAAFVFGWLVPVGIPLLRAAMWLVRPPRDPAQAPKSTRD